MDSKFEIAKKTFSKGSQKTWDLLNRRALNLASPYILMAVSAKAKSSKIGEVT